MRILMLNNEFPPLGGGTGTVNRALLQRWAREPNLEIDLITSAPGSSFGQQQFARNVRLYLVPVSNQNLHHSSNRELLKYASGALAMALRLQRAEPYDFVFAWSALPAGGVALAFKHLTGIPYLVRVCGPDIPGFELRYRSVYAVLTPLIRAVWRGAARVVAKCDDEAAMMRKVDSDVNPEIIPNGVDVESFVPASVPDIGPFRVLCVARLIERKGQRQIIAAAKRLVDAGMDVVIEFVGTGDAQQAYERQVQEQNLLERVHFAGYVPREEIAKRYAAAHVFVLASYNEGMSVATLEAMAAGLPLVVTRTGGTRELAIENVNALTFEWGDEDALTAHLAYLAEHREAARSMGRASRERARRFSWDTAASQYAEIFARIATMPKAASSHRRTRHPLPD